MKIKKTKEEKRPRSKAYPRFGYKYKTIASFSLKKETSFERETHIVYKTHGERSARLYCIVFMHVIVLLDVFEVHFKFVL